MDPEFKSVLDCFKKNVKKTPTKPFLGKRDDRVPGRPYVWMTNAECDEFVTNLARGYLALDLMPEIEGEGTKFRYMGIYSKNRPEWVLSDLACSTLKGVSIAFYDTLGPSAIEYVIRQTELTTITCSGPQLSKVILLKSQGKADSIKNLICLDQFDKSVQKDGDDVGIRVLHVNEVIEEGRKHPNTDLEAMAPGFDDIYMFCYTSGTTGDPKAAMLTHGNFLSAAYGTLQAGGVEFYEDDVWISYLPLAHSFEKAIFTAALICNCQVGYFSGDPLKLLDDLKELRPTCFPSVPRLFNRIYDKITAGLKEKSTI